MYVNGTLVMEDSVSITTERSFNQETFTFEAAPEIVPPEMQIIANLLRPTIAVTEDRIVVTTAPVAMKKEVRRLRKDDATHIGLAGITAPEGAPSLSFVDWGSAALSAHSMLVSIARMSGAIAEEDGAGASLAGLPWPDLIRRHFPSGFRWSVAADGVRITRSEASMDALDAMLVVAGGAIFMMFDKAVAEVELAQTQLALVEGAVQDYLLEHLKCPPTLEAAYPGSAPPLDPWGRPFVYQPLEGFEFEVRSAGPNGIDEGGEGDDDDRGAHDAVPPLMARHAASGVTSAATARAVPSAASINGYSAPSCWLQ